MQHPSAHLFHQSRSNKPSSICRYCRECCMRQLSADRWAVMLFCFFHRDELNYLPLLSRARLTARLTRHAFEIQIRPEHTGGFSVALQISGGKCLKKSMLPKYYSEALHCCISISFFIYLIHYISNENVRRIDLTCLQYFTQR